VRRFGNSVEHRIGGGGYVATIPKPVFTYFMVHCLYAQVVASGGGGMNLVLSAAAEVARAAHDYGKCVIFFTKNLSAEYGWVYGKNTNGYNIIVE